jgi:Bacterial PH domain
MRFISKCDRWLMLLLHATAVVQIMAGTFILWSGPERWAGALLLATAAFLWWLVATTFYVVGDTDVLIRSGPFWWRVPLHEIDSITPTWNPLSSPALSLDRLWICYRVGNRKRAIMVSPLDKAGFLRCIVDKVPELKFDGNRLSRSIP